jgi:flavodoxin
MESQLLIISMSSSTVLRGRSAVVVYSTRFGTTEVVAKALERGLRGAGMQTVCQNSQDITPESLRRYDLICVGGPTEVFGATKQMKDFLKALCEVDLEGKFGFAFDTKLDSRLSGSAAKFIEHSLDDDGLHIAAPRESAIVSSRKEGGKIVGAVLREGEERRFEGLGMKVGTAAADEMAKMGDG